MIQIVTTQQLSRLSGLSKSALLYAVRRGLFSGVLTRPKRMRVFELNECMKWFMNQGYNVSIKPWRTVCKVREVVDG